MDNDPRLIADLLSRQAVIQDRLERLSGELENINKMVRGSNGSRGMVAQMAVMESTATQTKESIEHVVKMLEEQNKKMSASEVEEKKGKFALLVAVIGGLMGMVTMIVTLALNLLLRKP